MSTTLIHACYYTFLGFSSVLWRKPCLSSNGLSLSFQTQRRDILALARLLRAVVSNIHPRGAFSKGKLLKKPQVFAICHVAVTTSLNRLESVEMATVDFEHGLLYVSPHLWITLLVLKGPLSLNQNSVLHSVLKYREKE